MKDLRLFGTEAYPIHPSGMRPLVVCPWSAAMRYLYDTSDEGGPAGDTGSAMHRAAAEFHRGKETAACIETMAENIGKYPKADLVEAAAMFLQYRSDTRNSTAEVVLVEHPIAFQIAPAPEDITQAPIQIIGTLDQVRRIPYQGLKLCDIKTSKRDAIELLHHHTFQMAAYCIGASIALKERVEPGPLILPRKYRAEALSQSPVFWHYPWTFDDIEQILSVLRTRVAEVRAGKLWHFPNNDCKWCHAQTPDICLPKLKTSLKELQVVAA